MAMKYERDAEIETVTWEGERSSECFYAGDLPVAIRAEMLVWGLHHYLRNSIADMKGKSEEEKLQSARLKFLGMKSGKMGAMPSGDLVTAIARLQDMSEERAIEKLLEASEGNLAELKKHPQVKREIARIQAERLELEGDGAEAGDISSLL